MATAPPDGYQQLSESSRRAFKADPLFRPHADFAFELKETVGAGGMATVHRVYDRRTRRQAALKVLNRDLRDPVLVERFIREARVTALLDHPAIPPVYEYGRNGRGEVYMLMKLIQGQTLRERLREFQRLGQPEDELAELFRVLTRVCEALGYAHERGVIHRDIKPENIMIGPHGEVYLMDWGLARELSDNSSDASSTTTITGSVFEDELSRGGQVVGTFAYMSPEQARGKPIDHRADLFGVGALLLEVLTGAPPYPGPGLAGQAQAMEGRVSLPRDARRRAPPKLLALALSCLHKDPARRPADARALVKAIRSHRGRSTRRRRQAIPWALLAIAVLALCLLAWDRERLVRRAATAEDHDEPELAPSFAVPKPPDQGQAEATPPSPPSPTDQTKAERAAALVAEAEARLSAKDPRGAIPLLERSLTLDPESADAESALGRAIFQTGDLGAALEHFTRAIAIAPLRSDGYNERGICLQRMGRSEKALADYQRALELEPRNVAAITNRAGLRADRGEIERALEDFAAAIPFGVELPTLFNNRGNLLRRLGRTKEAIADFDRAIELAPGYASAWYNRGLTRQKLDRLEAAIADYSRCLELDARNAAAFNNRGNCHKNLGRRQEALADYALAIAAEPSYPGPYVNRGKLLLKMGQVQRARDDLRRFLELAPEHPSADAVRAWLEK